MFFNKNSTNSILLFIQIHWNDCGNILQQLIKVWGNDWIPCRCYIKLRLKKKDSINCQRHQSKYLLKPRQPNFKKILNYQNRKSKRFRKNPRRRLNKKTSPSQNKKKSKRLQTSLRFKENKLNQLEPDRKKVSRMSYRLQEERNVDFSHSARIRIHANSSTLLKK